jgi:uncharacterized protein with von Willebrand factor type A (vWA) domain
MILSTFGKVACGSWRQRPVDKLQPSADTLLANLVHFGRLLRLQGLSVSIAQVRELASALTLIDISNRNDFYNTARSLLINDPGQFERFDRAFDLYWLGLQRWLVSLGEARLQRASQEAEDGQEPPSAALASNLRTAAESDLIPAEPGDDESSAEMRPMPTYSAVELLRQKNFAELTPDERELIRRALRSLVWRHHRERQTRRLRQASRRTRYLDLRGLFRRNLGNGGEMVHMTWRRRKSKPRPLVVICDISGSMEGYSRILLHFVHVLCQTVREVESFAFGTRLTRLTPALRYHDVDTAVTKAAALVVDWSGGTRIGAALRTFNREWSRRVLGRGAIVLIISDGWERGDMEMLAREIGYLSGSAHRLIWLNPLAGSAGYQPLVQGMRIVLPYCDEFLPLHNLQSVEQLVEKLAEVSRGN